MTVRVNNPDLPRPNLLMTPQYYKTLVRGEPREWILEAWDLMIGLKDLESCIATLKRALNKQNGIDEPEPKPEKEPKEIPSFFMALD